MNESERLADQLTKALNGDAWHGPSWSEALEGITREGALHRPITEAHSIAEIVLHATTWNDLVRRRLLGELPEVTETELVLAAMRLEDWPPATLTDESAWETARTRFFETGNALVQSSSEAAIRSAARRGGELPPLTVMHGGQMGWTGARVGELLDDMDLAAVASVVETG